MTAQLASPDLLREFLEVEYIWQIQKAILEKYSNVKIAFIVFDTNNDKYIFPDELSDRLLKKGISEEIDKHMIFFNFMDDDEDGRISFTDWTFGFQKIGRKIHETRNRLLEANNVQQNYSHSPMDHLPTRENQQSTPNKVQRGRQADPLVEQYIRYSPTRSANSPSTTSYIRMSPLVGARRHSPPHNEDLVKHMTHIPHDMANYSLSPIKALNGSTRMQGPSSPERVSFGPPKQPQSYNFLPASNEKQQNLVQRLYQERHPNPGRGHSPYDTRGYDLRTQGSPIQNLRPQYQLYEPPLREGSHLRSDLGSDIIELSESGLPKIRGAEFGYPEFGGDNLSGSLNRSAQDPYQTYYSPNPYNKKSPEISTKSTGLPSRELTAYLSDGRRDYQTRDKSSTYERLNQSANKIPSRYTTPEKYSEALSKAIEEGGNLAQEASSHLRKKGSPQRHGSDSNSAEEEEKRFNQNGMTQIVEEERESEFSQRGLTNSHRTPIDKTGKMLGSPLKSPLLSTDKKKGVSNQLLQEINEEITTQSHHEDSPGKILSNYAMILEPEIAEKPQDPRFFSRMERGKSKALKPEGADNAAESQVTNQRIRPSPVKVGQYRPRHSSPTKSPTKDLDESGRLSDRSERRSAGESLNTIEFKKLVIPEKTISDKILSADKLFNSSELQDLQDTKKSYSDQIQPKSGSSTSKYDRFVILEERTNEGSSPSSQRKAALQRLSADMRASTTSFESDKPENSERSLLYGKESPIKGGFTFPHEDKVKVMSIHELKQNLGDANCKSLRNFSNFLDSLSTFKLKSDNSKIPKKDTLRIAKTALSTYLLDHPDVSKPLVSEEPSTTASYLDFSGSSKLYLISEFTRLQMVSRQLKNANHTLKSHYPEVKLPSDRKTFLKK